MRKIIYFVACFLAIIGCSDILEEDLREKEVSLNSPLNMDTLTNYTVGFWWEELEGVEEYRIQIVSGSFDFPSALILDSTLVPNVFDFTLTPGLYEWKVKALNNSTETAYSSRSFYLEENEDLTDEQIFQYFPLEDQTFNLTDITLKWNPNIKAVDYLIDIMDDNGALLGPTEVLSEDTLDVILFEGIFVWSVQARNSTSISLSSSRTFTIDTTAPTIPSLILPISNAILDTNIVDFEWEHGASLTEVTDTLFVYTDSIYSLLDSYTLISEVKEVTFASPGTYYWRVRSVDEAGNNSVYSNQRKFTIN